MLSEHFSVAEFQCKCGCAICNVDQALINKLELLRSQIGKKIIITSGCRCPEWNKKIGGKPNSQHITTPKRACLAADIDAPLDADKYQLVKAAMSLGFSGIGINGSFLHLDLKLGDPRMWSY